MRILIFCLLAIFLGSIASWAYNGHKSVGHKNVGPKGVNTINNVEYCNVNGHSLRMDIYYPKQISGGKMPVVVFIHGGGWDGGDKRDSKRFYLPLANRGFVVASINYRLSGIASFPAQIQDCKCAIRYLRANANKYKINPNRIGVLGMSVGGHLAALLGTSGGIRELEGNGPWQGYSSRVQAVCDFFGPIDLMRIARNFQLTPHMIKFIGGTAADNSKKVKKINPVTYITSDDPPFLIIHGDRDPVVPLEQSQLLYQALRKNNIDVILHVVNGGNHGRNFTAREFRKAWEFFDRKLKN